MPSRVRDDFRCAPRGCCSWRAPGSCGRTRPRNFRGRPPRVAVPTAAPKSRKRFWLASAEMLSLEIIPYTQNRYLNHEDYALISWTSIRDNLQSGFEFDRDKVTTNQLGHTVSGALFFNAPRTNGYTFWESAPFVLAGSVVWEMAVRDAEALAERPREHDARRDRFRRVDVPALPDAPRRPHARRRKGPARGGRRAPEPDADGHTPHDGRPLGGPHGTRRLPRAVGFRRRDGRRLATLRLEPPCKFRSGPRHTPRALR